MPHSPKIPRPWSEELARFMKETRFLQQGAVVTDLDGTAVHEFEGRVRVHPDVSQALKRVAANGRPVVINSLRFPLNIVRTFGEEWAAISNRPLPIVSLNGSQIGSLLKDLNGEPTFEEIDAYPIDRSDIDYVLATVEKLLADLFKNLLVFFYPQDWRQGEIIWTPVPDNLDRVRTTYKSASECYASTVEQLRMRLESAPVCMMFLKIDEPQDRLMAYQHARPHSFITRQGVDKRYGWRQMRQVLKIEASDCIGAGDTPMDTFLSDCGLAVHVGPLTLQDMGRHATLKMRDPQELGALLRDVSEFEKGGNEHDASAGARTQP